VIAALANWKMDCGGNHRRSDVNIKDEMRRKVVCLSGSAWNDLEASRPRNSTPTSSGCTYTAGSGGKEALHISGASLLPRLKF